MSDYRPKETEWMLSHYGEQDKIEFMLLLCTGMIITPDKSILPQDPKGLPFIVVHAGPYASMSTLGTSLPFEPHYNSISDGTPNEELSLDQVVNWYREHLSSFIDKPLLKPHVFYGWTHGLDFAQAYGTFKKISYYFEFQRNDCPGFRPFEHADPLIISVNSQDRQIIAQPYSKQDQKNPLTFEI
jgi:hypothetical protein